MPSDSIPSDVRPIAGYAKQITYSAKLPLQQTTRIIVRMDLQESFLTHFKKIGFLWGTEYELSFSGPLDSDSEVEGYLFLCPLEDLQIDDGELIERPELPAHWSLAPSGAQGFSPKDASILGFPSLRFKRTV
ncbi:hypothetical protein B0H11DRAFT_2234478 [Mycena galericulata]|nr:hypothetical protein B0H11DRAFT_2234478 [Mycena galericulata]